MHTYEAKTFIIPTLEGISARSIEEHLGLYLGYVKNFNAMSGLITELAVDSEKNAHALSADAGSVRLRDLDQRGEFLQCGPQGPLHGIEDR